MDYINNIWTKPITNLEEKKEIARKIAEKVKDGDVIGFGSGSTSYVAIIEIANKIKNENINITAIPTSVEIELICEKLGIPTASIRLKKPNWCFDGADEVDKNCNLIKGRGGAMFREKLNICSSPKTYILVDKSKIVDKLGTNFPIPVECSINSINYVKEELVKLGASQTKMRMAKEKDGPVITENGNVIVDAKFNDICDNLEKQIKSITGVIESGLFIGYNVEVLG